MGEIADMAIEGECCQVCFAVFKGEGLGYPFTCDDCQKDIDGFSQNRRAKDRIPCPHCGRMISRVGMSQHYEAVHDD